MKSGIVSYGAYIPRYRIRPKDIGVVWGADGEAMGRGLNIRAKSVPGPDEDVITISVEAARAGMAKVDLDPTEIGAIYVGSESHPYAAKPTATIVAEAISSAPVLTAADFEFACKAGTAAIQTTMGLTLSKMMKYGLAIGSDTSQGAPGDALEYSASAGGAAFLIGVDHVAAEIAHTVSFTTDTPDFWRREGQRYPSHGGRFTGEPAYFKHVLNCAQLLFKRAGTTAEEYDYAVFHQPNGKFPVRAAKQLGFKEGQIDAGLCVREIGNTYSGAIMVGLCAILDEADPGDRIFAVGYGIDAVYIGNMSAGKFIDQEHVSALVADYSGLADMHLPTVRVEGGGACGAIALLQARLAIASGMHDIVVVGGAEKMTDVGEVQAAEILSSTADQEWESVFGATFAGLYAMMARRHMHEFGTTREQMAAVAVKNHKNGALNPEAQFQKEITIETVLQAPRVAEPLGVFDCAPLSDGAAAVVLCEMQKARKFSDTPIRIAGSGQASDFLALHDRRDLTTLDATVIAGKRAFHEARLQPKDVQLAEVHDNFTISDILAIEDLRL